METINKKERKPHFSSEEVAVIVEEVEANYARLYGAFSATLDQQEKKSIWENIVNKYVVKTGKPGLNIQSVIYILPTFGFVPLSTYCPITEPRYGT